jgi:adenylate cyclase
MDARELATSSGTIPDRVERMVALRILEPAEGGGFSEGDITRVRLALALEDSGISLDDVGRAIADGTLSFAFAEFATAAPVGLIDKTRAQLLDELGLNPGVAAQLEAALGLPPQGPEEPIREDDAELLSVGARAIAAGLPEGTLIRAYRIFTQNLERIAVFQNELFVRDIMGRMLESGMSRREMLEASGPIRVMLVELGFRGAFLIHRRLLERQAFNNLAVILEDLLDEAGVRRRSEAKPQAIAFLDLSGYTRLTEMEGDETAATHATSLAARAGHHRPPRRSDREAAGRRRDDPFRGCRPGGAVCPGARGSRPGRWAASGSRRHRGRPDDRPGWRLLRADGQPRREDRGLRAASRGGRERRGGRAHDGGGRVP